jgi:thiol-disulfide isomerase/thioredoxin
MAKNRHQTKTVHRKSSIGVTGWIKTALVTLLLSCALAVTSCKTRPPAPVENSASAYGWTLDNNRRAKLADYKGKVVVLDFYATWCEPCRVETPHLIQMQQQYGEQGLQVIGLNVGGEDDRDQVPGYAKELGIQYPLGFPDDELVDAYLTTNQNIPQAFVFDRTGRLVKRFIGYNEGVGQELERVVQVTLASGD